MKSTILPRRLPSPTHDAAHHRDHHAPLFCALPEIRQHVRHYVQRHTIPGKPPITSDGMTELWFDDPAGPQAVFSSPAYMATIRPDNARFLDLAACEFVVSTETLVIPAGVAP